MRFSIYDIDYISTLNYSYFKISKRQKYLFLEPYIFSGSVRDCFGFTAQMSYPYHNHIAWIHMHSCMLSYLLGFVWKYIYKNINVEHLSLLHIQLNLCRSAYA